MWIDQAFPRMELATFTVIAPRSSSADRDAVPHPH